MKVKRMVKRLFAVGTGVAMLGATAMGAFAADLNSYPGMFVTDGTYDGFFVVGENAASVDNLAMTDIAASMKYMATGGTSSVNVEGDAWQVQTGAEWLEFNESIGPSSLGVVDYIDKNDLGALADGELANSKGTFKYEQKLNFQARTNKAGATLDGPRAWFMEDEDDVVDVFWRITDGDSIAMYELDFVSDAETDIDASDSNALKDFEDKELTFMGTSWTMTNAKYTATDKGTVQLTFMGGATAGTLDEGDSQSYEIGGTTYDVAVTFVDADEGAFTVNGETTGKLEDGETASLEDGTEIGVSNILYQDYAGGVHQVSFFLGANKLYMTDVINDSTWSSSELKVNEETIDGANVQIRGTMVTVPSGTTTDGELKIDYIRINMTAQDDIYMAAGEKLSEDSDFSEPELLFTQNWDFEYHGFGDQETSDIKLKKSGDDKYQLEFVSNDGNTVTLPLMYATGNLIYAGKKAGDNFAFAPKWNITDDDYFVLNSKTASTAGNSDAVTTVLQYVSSKNSGDSTQTIKFKNINTGESFTRTFDDNCDFDISLNGRTHTFSNQSDNSCLADNWNIILTSTDYSTNMASTAGNGDATWGNTTVTYLRDASGALIGIQSPLEDAANNAVVTNSTISTPGLALGNNLGLKINVSMTDTDQLDDKLSVGEEQLNYNLTYTATNEVRSANLLTSAFEQSDPDDTDVTWGYTLYGSKLYHVAASSTPQEFTLTVPVTAGNIVAYITSGATTSTTSGDGTLTSVEVVDATKLDSEIADATAQNLIVVGGPCVNSVAAELLDNPADCTEGFTPGKARIKLIENGDNVAMLVAGYSGADTRLAGKVIAHRYSELSGGEVEVEGTTYSDATIGAPTVVEEVVEEVAEMTDETTDAAVVTE